MICNRNYFYPAVNALTLLVLILFAPSSLAECQSNAAAMYDAFKTYRQQLNTATHIDQLKPYFSDNFNQYYMKRLEKQKNQPGYNRFLTQYWDNLNTTRDIVIVFDYWAHCVNNVPALNLVVVLDSPMTNGTKNNTVNNEVALWQVSIYFLFEHGDWKIDSFEYRVLQSGNGRSPHRYTAADIIDNFVEIH